MPRQRRLTITNEAVLWQLYEAGHQGTVAELLDKNLEELRQMYTAFLGRNRVNSAAELVNTKRYKGIEIWRATK